MPAVKILSFLKNLNVSLKLCFQLSDGRKMGGAQRRMKKLENWGSRESKDACAA